MAQDQVEGNQGSLDLSPLPKTPQESGDYAKVIEDINKKRQGILDEFPDGLKPKKDAQTVEERFRFILVGPQDPEPITIPYSFSEYNPGIYYCYSLVTDKLRVFPGKMQNATVETPDYDSQEQREATPDEVVEYAPMIIRKLENIHSFLNSQEGIDPKIQKAYDNARTYIITAKKTWDDMENASPEERGVGAEIVKYKLGRLQIFAVQNQGEESSDGLDEWENLGEPQSSDLDNAKVCYSAEKHRLKLATDVEEDIKNAPDAPKAEWILKGEQIASKLLTLATTRPLRPHQLQR